MKAQKGIVRAAWYTFAHPLLENHVEYTLTKEEAWLLIHTQNRLVRPPGST
jgi:hypothetical protein